MRTQVNPRTQSGNDSLPIGTLGVIAEVLQTYGIDAQALMRRFGIHPRALNDPLQPSALQLHGRIMQAAIETTQIEHLPLLVGERSQLANVGPVKALALSAATAGEALDNLLHYAGLWYRGIQFHLEFDQGYAVLSFTTEIQFEGREALLTAFLAGAVRNLRLILGQHWKPSLVRMAHRRPVDVGPYSGLFRAPVLFDQPRHELLFPQTDLARRSERADPQLEVFLKRQLDTLKAQQPASFKAQVLGLVQGMLLRGDCSNERLAAQLGIHRHTLYRRLMAESTSYEALLEHARQHLAQSMLVDTEMRLAEIAAALGYSAQGNFSRAFVRWLGVTPSQWRESFKQKSALGSSTRI